MKQENELVKIETRNLFQKIKMWIKNLGYRERAKKDIPIQRGYQQEKTSPNNLIQELKQTRVTLHLQEEYERGNIREESLSSKEKEDLMQLYQKQIESLKQEIAKTEKSLEDVKEKIVIARKRTKLGEK